MKGLPVGFGCPMNRTEQKPKLSLSYVEVIPSRRSASDKMPLVITLHGRGSNGADRAGLGPVIDDGYRFICPDAPRAFYATAGMPYGFTWFDGWPPAPASFQASRKSLLDFIDEVRAEFPSNGKVALIGFSQGAMMALDLAFRMKDSPSAVIAMSGAVNESELPEKMERKDVPMLIVHGTQDDVIPVLYARKTRRILEDRGLSSEYHELPMGHWVNDESMALVKGFLAKSLR